MDERWKQIDRDEPIPAHIKEKMEECLKEILFNLDEIRPAFKDFAAKTLNLGNLSEKMLDFLVLIK